MFLAFPFRKVLTLPRPSTVHRVLRVWMDSPELELCCSGARQSIAVSRVSSFLYHDSEHRTRFGSTIRVPNGQP